jgi:uncharacterized protein (DUF2236 family)
MSAVTLADARLADERLADAAGLFGPGSISWRIDRELLVLAGGSCALLMQAAHPSVAAGVAEHSTYATDPFGRLLRTLTSSFDVVFGTRADAEATLRRVNAIHAAVSGTRPDGTPYSALEPEALLWVHSTLVDTALRVHDRFVAPISEADAQRYHVESAGVAIRLGVPESIVPPTIGELRSWMAAMIDGGTVRVTPQAREIARTVLYPVRFPPRLAWDAAHLVSIATLPAKLRRQYGLGWSPARDAGMGRIAAASRLFLPFVPSVLRHAPQARAADRRVGQAMRSAGSTR